MVVEKRTCYIYWVCVCSLSHAACVLHCHLWSVRLYNIFPPYLLNGTIFKQKFFNAKLFDFFTNLLWKTPHSKNNSEKCFHRSKYSFKVPVIRVRFSWIMNFLDRLPKNFHLSNFTIGHPGEAELFHADGQK